MSYIPTNQPVFLAAMSGAIAGMGASNRVPKSSVQASYAGLAAIAGAWAQSFDLAWNDATTASEYVLDTIATASEATWEQRGPTTASVVTLDRDTYNEQTAALVAMIRASLAYLTSQGITPGSGGGVLDGPDVVGPLDNNIVEQISGVEETYTPIWGPDLQRNIVVAAADYIGFGPTSQNGGYNVVGFRDVGTNLNTTNIAFQAQSIASNGNDQAGSIGMYAGVNTDKAPSGAPNWDFRYCGVVSIGAGNPPFGVDGWVSFGNSTSDQGVANNIPARAHWMSSGGGISTLSIDSSHWLNTEFQGMGQIRIGRYVNGGSYSELGAFFGAGVGCPRSDNSGNLNLIAPNVLENGDPPSDQVVIGGVSGVVGNGCTIKFLCGSPQVDIVLTGNTDNAVGAIDTYLEVEIAGAKRYIPLHLP